MKLNMSPVTEMVEICYRFSIGGRGNYSGSNKNNPYALIFENRKGNFIFPCGDLGELEYPVSISISFVLMFCGVL